MLLEQQCPTPTKEDTIINEYHPVYIPAELGEILANPFLVPFFWGSWFVHWRRSGCAACGSGKSILLS